MKTKDELLYLMASLLEEIQDNNKNLRLQDMSRQKIELALLYEILGDEVPPQYWEGLEELENIDIWL